MLTDVGDDEKKELLAVVLQEVEYQGRSWGPKLLSKVVWSP